ncbi:MAG: twin-arginine translocase TatA/TatE family subunit [Verrucomicrobiales bacterium]|nr:twin-arginine translocase TatA/TatE family subunit [Verrucomicrobiales bacterium]
MNFVTPNLLFAMLGTTEIIIIAVVVVVLFGARKIPDLMKGVGTGIKEFKKAAKDDETPLKPS